MVIYIDCYYVPTASIVMSVTSIVYDIRVAVSSPVLTMLKVMPVYTSKFVCC